ncbi:uncharacterized protein SPAPADRAFT_61557 [Spathaspora passalidarum NRRL Y-27907]|uniref:C2H2-type domain-containing protein n=1 Tax=Spathaspora passalidarum (strain NRRL Y-27907 / 11-Y1) TaxID=619300 RepID=G3ANA7_SPAPN|nr:uncharacterized protein SPAPADRAFT_61557 [Spathaspora passalidarum NRRL Y-27907]EGW32490.1 hypothetical protein SPAPADRAFT_61557 [Spathaspora passalidarum NRRL Y-27907]
MTIQAQAPQQYSMLSNIYTFVVSTVLHIINAIYHFILPLPVIPEDVPKTGPSDKAITKTKKTKKPPTLFPSISEDATILTQRNTTKEESKLTENELRKHTERSENLHTPISCSTGLTTRLLPFKNDKGEIEWTFTDDVITPGHELDAFRMDKQPVNSNDIKHHDLSPTISNTSNSSTLSQKIRKENSATPTTTNTTSPFTPDVDDDKSSVSSQGEQSAESPDAEGKIHHCPHCDATFKIRGYLTRHLKKHAVNKAYTCPFHKVSIYIDENNITHKCHPNGGFSRRDTYKTHLKSRHFKYPKGTKTKQRATSSGSCSMCGEFFPNAEIWCELHVEGGECKYLPAGFKGKSRIKNRLRKQLEKNKDVDPDLLPYASRVIGEVNRKSDMEETPGSMDTPYGESPGSYNTPTSIMRSPLSYMTLQNPPVNNTAYFDQQQLQPHLQQDFNQQRDIPQFDQFTNTQIRNSLDSIGEYDDEFCLDIDQLNNATFNNFNEIVNYVKLNQQQLQQSLQQQQQQQYPIPSPYAMSQSPDSQSQQQQQVPQQPVMMYQY